MRKVTFLGAVLAGALLVLAGCASSSPQQSGQAPQRTPVPQPIIGAEGIPQPEWVRNPGSMETADKIYFVGEGREGGNKTERKNTAFADAGRQVGDWKESIIKAAIKDYVQGAGETGSTQSLEYLEVASIQRARAHTSGIYQSTSWIAPDNTYVLLVSYPKNDLKRDFRASLNDFVRNEGAQYAEFKANEAFRYLEQELEPPKQ
ncbi:MAG: hypothetical protein LBD31_06865 [Treponema sp.]|jgi:hypothetical protein|nr:hypothetical protein [Treponema sp.]